MHCWEVQLTRSDHIMVGVCRAGVDIANTNQLYNSNDAWFVAFAPYINPEIAVAVVVEGGGGGGSTAAPVAREIIEAFHTKRVHSEKLESRVDSTASYSLSQR